MIIIDVSASSVVTPPPAETSRRLLFIHGSNGQPALIWDTELARQGHWAQEAKTVSSKLFEKAPFVASLFRS